MEIYARRRLVETYYKSYDDRKLIEQSNRIEDIIKSITDVSEKKSILADIYYYKGKKKKKPGFFFFRAPI